MDQLSQVSVSGAASATPVRSKRLSVNAAFLKDIKDDNRELKALIDRLYPRLKHPQIATNHWLELPTLLADLRDQLAVHFSLEEAFGYFEDAIDAAPQVSLAAEQLKGEHTRLFQWSCDLADQVFEVKTDSIEKVAVFVNQFQRFRTALEKHETAEIELILQAMDDDLGVAD